MTSCMQDIINTVRVLSAEEVEAAESGHPGTPLGIAPVVCALYAECMKINPRNAKFFDRDRFVLSSGHAYEAAGLAAVWDLGKLILIYDSNGTTIEGNTDIAFPEDVAARHEALGWHVQKVDSADTGEGRTRNKLRFEREELHTVERDMEEIKKEQDLLLKIFEDELLEDGEDSDGLPEKDAADHG